MNIVLSQKEQGILGLVGHVGVGHAHSLGGIVQDDSAGFAAVGSLLREALQVDTTIASAVGNPETGVVEVTTQAGGIGRAFAARGITPAESQLMERAKGLDGLLCQRAAVTVMGRIYGQGAGEAACALETAIALAVVNSMAQGSHGRLKVWDCALPDRDDCVLAGVIEIDGLPVSVMLVVNATQGGIGPDEDYEGNVMLGEKYQAMTQVGLHTLPTIVVESKFYRADWSGAITRPCMVVRSQKDLDDTQLGEVLSQALRDLEVEYQYRQDAMPSVPGSLQQATRQVAEQIIQLARQLGEAQTALEKVRLTAQLNRLVSEDAGGVTFMSNRLNERVRGAGLEPHTGAVLSLLVTEKERNFWKIPLLTQEDLILYQRVLVQAVKLFAQK